MPENRTEIVSNLEPGTLIKLMPCSKWVYEIAGKPFVAKNGHDSMSKLAKVDNGFVKWIPARQRVYVV
jgi:hypothetical protein